MPRRKQPRRQTPELLSRLIEVTNVSAGVSFSAQTERGAEPELSNYARIELAGRMDEPIRGVQDIEIVVYPSDEPRPGKEPIPWVGLVHGVKPVLRPSLFVSHQAFDRLWSLAMSGLLKHAHMVLTPPRYNTAYVVNISFSTHREE